MSTEESPLVLEQNIGSEVDESKLNNVNKAKTLESTSKPSELSTNNPDLGDINEVSASSSLDHSKPETAKPIIKKEYVPGNLSPLSKKLRRDSLRTQLKRACTLALTEQPKMNPTSKRRCRRHSTGTSKDTTKKTVIKKKVRKSLASNTLKRKREESTDEHRVEELKYTEDLENLKEAKFRRKSNESSLSEPIKSEIFVKSEKELNGPINVIVESAKRDSNTSNSPVRARRSTRLSPETIPKKIVSAKKRGRPVKTVNSDSSLNDNRSTLQVTQKGNDCDGKFSNNKKPNKVL